MQLLRPSEQTRARRRVCCTNYHVVEGAGYSMVGGQRLDWEDSGVRRHAAALQSLVSAGARDRLARAEEPVQTLRWRKPDSNHRSPKNADPVYFSPLRHSHSVEEHRRIFARGTD